MKKRNVAVLVLLALGLSVAFNTAISAKDYKKEIFAVMDELSMMEKKADNVFEQSLNGTYRSVQMLEIIARLLDKEGKYATEIDGQAGQRLP